ncbi:MAG: Ig-like domain-containing protein [Methylococcales bacterium]|nr:Ig-like domain-containing protein [Methylococcales bacterium]
MLAVIQAKADATTGVSFDGTKTLTFTDAFVGSTFTYDLTAVNDGVADNNETIIGTLTNATTTSGSASIVTPIATTTITDTDGGIGFALTSTPTISEESTETSTFTLTMTGFPLGSGQTSAIDIEGTGTATNGGTDYTSTMLAVIQAKADATTGVSFDGTKTLTFTDAFVGSTFTYDLTAVNDGVADNNETIIGTLTNATTTSGSASIVTPVATTTITDTDGGVSFALTSTPTINEESTETSTFTLTMTGFPLSSGQTSTIDIEGTGTATNGGTDYTSTMLAVIQAKADATTGVSFDGTKTLTFTDAFVGSTFTYDLTAVNDGVADNNETIIGTLTNATTTSGSASIVTPIATTTITDTDGGVSFALTSTPTINEESTETSTFTLTMTGFPLSSGQTSTIDIEGTGTATNGGTDYTSTMLAVIQAKADATTGVSFDGTKTLTFTDAFVGSTFTYDLTAVNDGVADNNETIIGTLTNATTTSGSASIVTPVATTTITDTDGGVSFALTSTPTINEESTETSTFTLTMTGFPLSSGQTSAIDIEGTGTATNGGTDYTSTMLAVIQAKADATTGVSFDGTKTLTFTDAFVGSTFTYDLTAVNDGVADNNETIIGTLTNATTTSGSASIVTPIATTTITDTDGGIGFALTSTPTISEESTETSTFTLTMTGFPLGSGQTSAIDIEGTGTATNGGTDYTSTMLAVIQAKADATTGVSFDGTKTLTFTDAFVGSTFTYDLTAVNDGVADNNETIIGTLTNATTTSGSASIVTPIATTTITDTDGGVSFALTSTPTINEESTETSTFTLTMTGFPLSSGQTSTIDIEGTGTATNGGTDYTSTMLAVIQAKADATTGVSFDGTKTLTFTDAFVGSTFTYDLTAVNDGVADNNETIIGTLTNATTTSGSASIVTPIATTTITDTDTPEPDTPITPTPTPIDTQPNAIKDIETTQQDQAVVTSVLKNDTLGDQPTKITSVTQGSNGSVVKNNDGTVTYTPDTGFTGNDFYTYTITDKDGDTSTATVLITIIPLPHAIDDKTSTEKNIPVISNVLTNDNLGGEPTKITSVTQGTHGSVVNNNDGTITYTPNSGFIGVDNYMYTLTDKNGNTTTATVTIEVNGLPDAIDDNVTTPFNTAIKTAVLNNDNLGNKQATITAITQASNGTVTNNLDGTITYLPNLGFTGIDSYTYTFTDSDGNSETATVKIVVGNQINDIPLAQDDSVTTLQDNLITIDVLNNDQFGNDNAGITDIIIPNANNGLTQPTNGTLILNNGGDNDPTNDTITYIPNSGFVGVDTFQYTLTDSNGDTSTAIVKVTVNSLTNDIPLAQNDVVTTLKNDAITFSVLNDNGNGVDNFGNDGSGVTGIIIPNNSNGLTQPNHGRIVLNNGGDNDPTNDTITYIPNQGFVGTDSFQYTITDSNGDTSTATVTVIVTGRVNNVPVAQNDSVITRQDNLINIDVLNNDKFGGDQAGIVGLIIPNNNRTANGFVFLNDQGDRDPTNDYLTYIPDRGFVGSDSFQYTITDRNGDTSTAIVQVNILPNSLLIPTEDIVFLLQNSNSLGQQYTPLVEGNHSVPEEVGYQPLKVMPYVYEVTTAYEITYHILSLPEINPVGMEGQLKDQFVTDGTKTYDAGSKFTHSDNEKLNYEAALSDGKPLPDFVTFDVDSGQFLFNAEDAKAASVPSVLIRLIASDKHNNQASSIFQVRFDVESSEADATRKTRGGNNSDIDTSDSYDGRDYNPNKIKPLRLTGALESLFLMEGEYEYKIPKSAFKHVDPNEKLAYLSTLGDGTALPDFVSFDPDSKLFLFDADAAHEAGTLKIAIKVIVEDSKNNVVTTTFEVSFYIDEEALNKAKREAQQQQDDANDAVVEESSETLSDVNENEAEPTSPEAEEDNQTNEEEPNDDENAVLLENDFSNLALLLGGTFNIEADALTESADDKAKHSLNEQVKQAGFFGYQQDKGQLLADLESVFNKATG